MQNTWFIIVNPNAGKGLVAKRLKWLCSRLEQKDIAFVVEKSKAKDHATKLVQAGIARGLRNIIAVGGDGTNNEVVNGIMNQRIIPSQDIRYALLPSGTGNDWIKEYGIPMDLDAWFEMFVKGKTFLQDVGLVSYQSEEGVEKKRYFVNVAGMSYDAFVVREMDLLKKPISSRLAYLLYGLSYVFRYKIPQAQVWIDEKYKTGKYYLINAGICRYSGGGMQLVPHARPADGRLAITLAGHLTKLGVLLNSYRFYNGTIGGHSKVDTFYAKTIRVNHEKAPILLEVDGEYLGTTPVEMKVIKGALQVVVP